MRAVFFVAFEGLDWMGTVQAEEDEAPHIEYRFRYYDPTPRPDDVWDGVDRKSWFRASMPGGAVHEAIESMSELWKLIALTHPSGPPKSVDSVVQEDGDQEAFVAQCETKPWIHMKSFPSEEEAKRFLKSKEPS